MKSYAPAKEYNNSNIMIDPKRLLEHHEMITALMIAIKPSVTQIYC
jgi:hypothetical protein